MENKYTYWTLIIKYGDRITGLIKDDDNNLVSVNITPSFSEKHKYENIKDNEIILSMTKFLDGRDQVNFKYLNDNGFDNIINGIVNIGSLIIEDIESINNKIAEDPSYFNQLWDEMEKKYFIEYEDYFDEFHNREINLK